MGWGQGQGAVAAQPEDGGQSLMSGPSGAVPGQQQHEPSCSLIKLHGRTRADGLGQRQHSPAMMGLSCHPGTVGVRLRAVAAPLAVMVQSCNLVPSEQGSGQQTLSW